VDLTAVSLFDARFNCRNKLELIQHELREGILFSWRQLGGFLKSFF
jgi:hypothetical protein